MSGHCLKRLLRSELTVKVIAKPNTLRAGADHPDSRTPRPGDMGAKGPRWYSERPYMSV